MKTDMSPQAVTMRSKLTCECAVSVWHLKEKINLYPARQLLLSWNV